MTLTFDAPTHTYRLDGTRIPSVTQVLRPLYNFDKVAPDDLERALELGTSVHLMTEYHDKGTLDETTLTDELIRYLDAYKSFLDENQVIVHGDYIECRLANPKYRYGMTLDRVVQIKYKRRTVNAVGDIKTGGIYPAVGPQLAAYQEGFNVMVQKPNQNPSINHRFSINLKPDGRYDLNWWDDPADWKMFLALLQIKNWRMKHYGDANR